MNIDINKQYRTNDGRPVRLLCIDRKVIGGKRVVGLVNTNDVELIMTWHTNGECATDSSLCDLVEVQPYEDFNIDDKVLVKLSDENEWKKRYFAGVDYHGRPLTFVDGKTSWNGNETTFWEECIKAPEE